MHPDGPLLVPDELKDHRRRSLLSRVQRCRAQMAIDFWALSFAPTRVLTSQKVTALAPPAAIVWIISTDKTHPLSGKLLEAPGW